MNSSGPSKKILVTSGPTREFIDPVRYISNLSTGVMGKEIANEALKRGHEVLLIKGPSNIYPEKQVKVIDVGTARQMQEEIKKEINKIDCLVMSAAVCDFRPEEEEKQKIKKQETLTLKLVKNPDILKALSNNKKIIKIGFALETENLLENAKKKLQQKDLNLIIANLKTEKKHPFGEGKKDYLFISKNGKTKEFKKIEKRECAKRIIDEIEKL